MEQAQPSNALTQYQNIKKEHPEAIIWESQLGVFRYPVTLQEHDDLEVTIVDSFADNLRYALFGITREQAIKKIAHFREWEIKNNNRWAIYDYKTGQLMGTCKAMKGDIATMPELSAEIKSWDNMTKADAIMDECKKRAKA